MIASVTPFQIQNRDDYELELKEKGQQLKVRAQLPVIVKVTE